MLFEPFVFPLVFALAFLKGVFAVPANEKVVEEFLDCLHFHNATGYAYNVTSTGELIIAPLAETTEDNAIDRAPWSICNRLFGLGFQCSLDFGVRTYNPDTVLLDLNDATASGLIESGLQARPLPPMIADSFEQRMSNFKMMARDMGFPEDTINQFLGIELNLGNKQL